MIILRLTPLPWKTSPRMDSLILSLLVGALPPVQTSLQVTLRRISKSYLTSHQNHSTLNHQRSHKNHWNLCHLRMNWEDSPSWISSSFTAFLSLRFPRAWMRTRSINSALVHFQRLVGKRFYMFVNCPRNKRKSVPFSYSFCGFCI